MAVWGTGVSLKDRKRSEDLCILLGINCVADVVRRGRLRWFGHLEHKSVQKVGSGGDERLRQE